MKSYMVQIDHTVFSVINSLPHTPLSDGLALFFSGIEEYGLIWILVGIVLFIREEKKDHMFFFPMIVAGFLSWVSVIGILKPVVGRLRPLFESGAIIVDQNSTGFSFPSFHATGAWAFAVVLAHKEPAYRFAFYTLAGLISLSRVYVGVHYPLDIVVGGLLGFFIGTLSIYADRYLRGQKTSS